MEIPFESHAGDHAWAFLLVWISYGLSCFVGVGDYVIGKAQFLITPFSLRSMVPFRNAINGYAVNQVVFKPFGYIFPVHIDEMCLNLNFRGEFQAKIQGGGLSLRQNTLSTVSSLKSQVK